MALSAAALGPLLAAGVGVPPTDLAGQAAWLSIANILVTYITTNAVVPVLPTALVAPSGGGPVTGTATGTIT